MNVYDIVQRKTSEIAGIISVVLGLCLIVCSCWVLNRTLQSESLAYFSYGLRVGALKLETINGHEEAFDILTSRLAPYITILKVTTSLGLIAGILQVGSILILIKRSGDRPLRLWLGVTIVSGLISIVALILPFATGMVEPLEVKIFVTVSAVTLFLLIHLVVVVAIQLRSAAINETAPPSMNTHEPPIIPKNNPNEPSTATEQNKPHIPLP